MKRFVDRVGIRRQCRLALGVTMAQGDSLSNCHIDRNPRWAAATLRRFSLRRGVSKSGNRKGPTTGIELAWLWLRHQPDGDLSVASKADV
jgi:hypothetical protein